MIGYAALKAGILLDKNNYLDFGLNILIESTARDNHFKEKLVLCNEFTSLSHIYHRIYLITKNEIFEDRSSYWKDKSLELFWNRYQKHQRGHTDDFFEDSSLFIGCPGFFLSLIAWEYSDYENDWIKCLLL